MTQPAGGAVTKLNPHAQKLEELRKQYGDLAHTTTPSGKLLAFRRPDIDEFEDYQDSLELMRAGKKRKGACFREVAELTCVHPTIEELQAEFQRWPALPALISDELALLSGANIEFTIKKD